MHQRRDKPAVLLSVEDNEASRYVRARQLSPLGWQVLEAASGFEALQIAQKQHPDLIVLDVHLPDISGTEVCRRLKADPDTADILVIQVSAVAISRADTAHGLDTGADAYLTVPLDEDVLRATVRALLRLQRSAYSKAAAAQQIIDSLRAVERRRSDFIAMLAHELRAPLTPLTNAHRVLERAETLSERGRAMLDMAGRQTRHLQRLVDDLVDAARMTTGAVTLLPEPMDLRAAVRAAVESLTPTFELRQQRVAIAVPEHPVRLVADPVRITQVFENLLTNASKFTPEGGSIRIDVDDGAETVELRVQDTGIGIEPDKIGMIFDLFRQVDPAFDRAKGGLGIGLALVKRLVEQHGGSVVAASDGLGKGATFTVRLPRDARRAS